MPAASSTADYSRIEKAIRFLDANRHAQPTLIQVARHVGLSETHFQKLFTRWAGISPKRFLQHQTAEIVKQLLRDKHTVLDASYEAGLSGSSRLHDLIVNAEAVTPGDLQRSGEGLVIRYGFHPSPFGECLIATTPRGICHLAFMHPVSRTESLARLRHDWPAAELEPDQDGTRGAVAAAFPAPGRLSRRPLALHVKGTNFQLKVWRALLAIPDGDVTTYGALALAVGNAAAARAVGTAAGSNPVSFLIPCHRVIRSTGQLGGYAWGIDRKRVMLACEVVRPLGQKPEILPGAPRASASGARPVRSA
jgi:AraC family transcriptional regulator of adaptative response/methylated-DNA-[protein]-cysteine methyltransferase